MLGILHPFNTCASGGGVDRVCAPWLQLSSLVVVWSGLGLRAGGAKQEASGKQGPPGLVINRTASEVASKPWGRCTAMRREHIGGLSRASDSRT